MNRQQFYDLLVLSTRDVFETMSFLDVTPQPAIEEAAEIEGIDITGTVCLAGELSGMLAVHSSREFAEQCAELITGGEGEITINETCDTVGELANMIAGTLKRRISAQFDLFELSLPSISLSRGQRLFYSGAKGDFPRLLVPFSLDERDHFYVELLYHRR